MRHGGGPVGLRYIASSIATALVTLSTMGLFRAAAASSVQIPLSTSSDTVVEKADGPISVMVVGDSITQGHEGDWTWRYRLWQWFRDQDVKVNFVGPWDGTWPVDQALPLSQSSSPGSDTATQISRRGYAVGVDPEFDSRHFSAWGRQLRQDCDIVGEMVTRYNPDYLLVLLGFNDMGWLISDANGTFESMNTFINEARAAKPNIKMALGNIPHRTLLNGREDLPAKTDRYNELLEAAIPQLSTTTSQIKLVQMQENYDCDSDGCEAGYDGLHPNALGEYQIAQAFSRTLVNNFSIGNSELAIPLHIPDRPLPLPTNFRVVSDEKTITVTWNAVYGATGYDLHYKRVDTRTWHLSSKNSNRYEMPWSVGGEKCEFRIRTKYGDTATVWSDSITVYRPQTTRA